MTNALPDIEHNHVNTEVIWPYRFKNLNGNPPLTPGTLPWNRSGDEITRLEEKYAVLTTTVKKAADSSRSLTNLGQVFVCTKNANQTGRLAETNYYCCSRGSIRLKTA